MAEQPAGRRRLPGDRRPMSRPQKAPSAGPWLAGAVVLTMLAACNGLPPPSLAPTTAQTPTATPFLPAPPSPTPARTRLWLSPSAPADLRERFRLAAESNGALEIVAEPQGDALALVQDPGATVAEWIYVVAAPFPTVRDSITMAELERLWREAEEPTLPIYVSPATEQAVRTILGEPGANVRIFASSEMMVDAAWDARPSLAIIPFDELDVRWKVLELNGASPLRPDFDRAGYPLRVGFGLAGGAALDALESVAGPLPVSNRDPARMTTVVMTGVTALTRATAWQMSRRGATFPANDVGEWLRSADVTHISHEVAFAPDCPPPSPDLNVLIFCSAPANIELLEVVGTDVVELTGNHLLDAGPEALRFTLDLYRQRGWRWFGGGASLGEASEPVRLEQNGNRIAFVGCNEAGPAGDWATTDRPGANPCGADRLVSQIAVLRQAGYLPIATFQWHEHYTPRPPLSQREAFRAAAAAGAAAVSGSQAHQPQAFEFVDGAFIHYGLGNLFFDQMWSTAVRQEFIDRYVFYDGRLISVELLTAYLEDWSRPRPMTPDERAAFLEDMFAASGW